MRTRETCKLFCSLAKQATFCNATSHSVFPAKCPDLRNERRNFILVTCHHPDLGSSSHWLKQIPSRDDPPEVLLRSGEWKVISMEFLRSFLRCHIAGKLVTEWWCREISTISLAPTNQTCLATNQVVTGCGTLLQNFATKSVLMHFLPTQESEVTPPLIYCKTDLSSVCSYTNLKKSIIIFKKIENENENLQLHLIHCKSLEGKKNLKTYMSTANIFLLN